MGDSFDVSKALLPHELLPRAYRTEFQKLLAKPKGEPDRAWNNCGLFRWRHLRNLQWKFLRFLPFAFGFFGFQVWLVCVGKVQGQLFECWRDLSEALFLTEQVFLLFFVVACSFILRDPVEGMSMERYLDLPPAVFFSFTLRQTQCGEMCLLLWNVVCYGAMWLSAICRLLLLYIKKKNECGRKRSSGSVDCSRNIAYSVGAGVFCSDEGSTMLHFCGKPQLIGTLFWRACDFVAFALQIQSWCKSKHQNKPNFVQRLFAHGKSELRGW